MSEIAIDIALSRGDFQLSLNTRLPAAGVTGICGPSGSGKTSLLSAIAGLIRGGPGSHIALDGELLEGDGQWLPPQRRDVACVFQDARLFPHLDVLGNVTVDPGAARLESARRAASE